MKKYMRQDEAEEKIRILKNRLAQLRTNPLPGRLDIKTNGRKPEYFHCMVQNGTKERKYLKQSDLPMAKNLAQQVYNKRISSLLDRLSKKASISSLSVGEIDRAVDKVYSDMHPLRQALVTPIQMTAGQKFQAWKARSYQGLGFREDDPKGIITNNHERVRSKSEKILADLFSSKNIFYKYECPLHLANNIVFYPDFTFFLPPQNQEIYWEHFGLMDSPDYAINTIRKIRTYEENGIFTGIRLIMTFEGLPLTLDTNRAEALIDRFQLYHCFREYLPPQTP